MVSCARPAAWVHRCRLGGRLGHLRQRVPPPPPPAGRGRPPPPPRTGGAAEAGNHGLDGRRGRGPPPRPPWSHLGNFDFPTNRLLQTYCVFLIDWTYTNYVHRARGEAEMLFINTLERPNVKITEGRFEITQTDKEFSWWRTGWCMDVDPSTIAWMREWPEVLA